MTLDEFKQRYKCMHCVHFTQTLITPKKTVYGKCKLKKTQLDTAGMRPGLYKICLKYAPRRKNGCTLQDLQDIQ